MNKIRISFRLFTVLRSCDNVVNNTTYKYFYCVYLVGRYSIATELLQSQTKDNNIHNKILLIMATYKTISPKVQLKNISHDIIIHNIQ